MHRIIQLITPKNPWLLLGSMLCVHCAFGQQNGLLDGNFDGDGMLKWEFLGNLVPDNEEGGQAVALQPDGKIVLTGNMNGYVGEERFNPDGSVDEPFAGFGENFWSISDQSLQVTSIVTHPNGDLIKGGMTTDASGVSSFVLLATDTTGHRDNGFGDGGYKILSLFSSPAGIHDLALQSDGRIVAAGFETEAAHTHFALARFQADGSLDNSFSFDGLLTAQLGAYDFANAVVIQPDGKILAAGAADTGQGNAFAFVRFNASGTLDNSFGNAGKMVIPFPGSTAAFCTSVVLQPDGKIVAGGLVTDTQDDFGLLRLNTDGSIDPTFGVGGFVITSFPGQMPGTFEAISDLALQQNGRIIAVGESNNMAAVACYLPDGTLDATFGQAGLVTTQYPGNDHTTINDCLLQPDGNLLVAGTTFLTGDDRDAFMARYLFTFSAGTVNPLAAGHKNLIYPNPVASGATFGFDLQAAATVRIAIVDTRGQVLQQPLASVALPAGKQELPLSLSQLTSGIYQLVLYAGDHVVTTQFVKE